MINGASLKQIGHYGHEARFSYFGKYEQDSIGIPDFPLHKITAPIGLHYSDSDLLANGEEVQRLIAQLCNSELRVQAITVPKLNHVDFLWGERSAALIYSEILKFFGKYCK